MVGKLTLKQRKFWKHYSEHHNKAAAAKYAGCQCTTVQSYSTQGAVLLKSLELTMPELLAAQGLGTDRLAEIVDEQTTAKKPVYATWEGKITDVQLHPDNAARGKAAELLGRMHGVFIDRHELTGKDGGDLILQVNPSKSRKGNKISIDMEE